ncbi:Uncharacterised protein [uncultured archaeon]|nr:Uncharacterised protein [uncultured archaeon]
MKRLALATTAWRADSRSFASYFITMRMSLERETAVGLVSRRMSAACLTSELKSSRLCTFRSKEKSLREAAAAVAILPAPLISMLLIFPAVSNTTSLGSIFSSIGSN